MAFDDGECRVNYSTSSRRGHTGRFVHAIKSVNTESAKAKEWDRRTQGKKCAALSAYAAIADEGLACFVWR
jgi:hypothetical protein